MGVGSRWTTAWRGEGLEMCEQSMKCARKLKSREQAGGVDEDGCQKDSYQSKREDLQQI